MPPTIIYKNASNWVDRGEPPNKRLRQALGFFFCRDPEAHAAWLEERALTILGMVAADAPEVHIVGFLRSIGRELGLPEGEPRGARGVAITLWHIAKVALVRDFAERVLQGDVPANEPTPDSFSHWVASRLLTPEELAEFEQTADGGDPEMPARRGSQRPI